jgi:hypothetical protein
VADGFGHFPSSDLRFEAHTPSLLSLHVRSQLFTAPPLFSPSTLALLIFKPLFSELIRHHFDPGNNLRQQAFQPLHFPIAPFGPDAAGKVVGDLESKPSRSNKIVMLEIPVALLFRFGWDFSPLNFFRKRY